MPNTERPRLTAYSFRLSAETARQMRDLARIWGESQTQTLARCIERAYQQENTTMRTNSGHKTYMTQTGSNEWGRTYTIYSWDTEMNIYREVVTGLNYAQARHSVAESNKSKK